MITDDTHTHIFLWKHKNIDNKMCLNIQFMTFGFFNLNFIINFVSKSHNIAFSQKDFILYSILLYF